MRVRRAAAARSAGRPGTGGQAAKVSVSRYQDPLISLSARENDRIWFRLQAVAGLYAVLDYRLGHRGLPLAPVAAVLANTIWLPALASAPLIILLFPDRQLVQPPGGLSVRWRRGHGTFTQ